MFQFSIMASRSLQQLIFKQCMPRSTRPCVDFVRQVASSKSELPKPPKRSPGMFVLFYQDKREKIAAENPGKKITELAKIAGAMWKRLDEKEKKFYEEEEQKRNLEFAEEYEVYVGSLTENQKKQLEEEKYKKILNLQQKKQKTVRKKEENELNKPKRPSTSYGLFVKDWYAKNASEDSVTGSVLSNSKVVADIWVTLPKEEKMVYSNKAEELMSKYNKDLLKWYHKMEAQGRLELVPKKYLLKAITSKRGRKTKSGADTE
ncbi:hypothetical protein CHS0354_019054 [Potamilus streckersoni]|uniref:HMG box domain-containing protein n=1 Tax=Potamilus streckersoni TaxID=2493646 RepID=A0AAE0SJH7_9BIVA|nr:hypothetical protein CHS0354_019054 [Potamilus streckersoni]